MVLERKTPPDAGWLRGGEDWDMDSAEYNSFFKAVTGFKPYQFQTCIAQRLLSGNNVIMQAPTGERVIIVMGAICVIKSRVSGTFNKYISCTA